MDWTVTAEHRGTEEEIRKIWRHVVADSAEEAIDIAHTFFGGGIHWPPGTHWTAEKEE